MAALPETMSAFRCTGPATGSEDTVPVPKPGTHEVLVKVVASDVNPADYKTFNGLANALMPYPYTPGCDLAGTVVAVGPDVTDFKVGDEVFGMTGGLAKGPAGTLADYAIAWDDTLALKPTNLTMRQAAAIPLVLTTAWEGMMDRHKVKATDYVLVTGASGGVGSIAVQLARASGATHVFGLASESKRALVEQNGAKWFDYKLPKEELIRLAKEQTPNGRGFDVVFDAVGGEMLDLAIDLVAPHGYITTIIAFGEHQLAGAALKGALIAFPLACLHFFYPEKPGLIKYLGSMLRDAVPLLAEGKVVVQVDEEHPFPFSKEGVLGAYKLLESGKNHGKVVINVAAE